MYVLYVQESHMYIRVENPTNFFQPILKYIKLAMDFNREIINAHNHEFLWDIIVFLNIDFVRQITFHSYFNNMTIS